MAVTGDLATMAVPELLEWLASHAKSGKLTIRSGMSDRTLWLRDGRVFSTSSNDPQNSLGRFCIRHGRLTAEEHERAMEVQRETGIGLGKILVMIDLLTEAELHTILARKAEVEIAEVLGFEEGTFRFDHGERPQGDLIEISLNLTRLLLEASRMLDESRRSGDLPPVNIP